MNVRNITLDVSKEAFVTPPVVIGQGDKQGTTIRATIYDNGAETTLTGMSARFCMRLPGGVDYVRDASCTVSGSTVTYVVDESHCAAVAGETRECYFELLSGSAVVYSTSRFAIRVLRSVTDGATPGEAYDDMIEEAIASCNNAVALVQQVLDDGIPLMSASIRGGAKLGNGLMIDENGVLYVSALTAAEVHAITGIGGQGAT